MTNQTFHFDKPDATYQKVLHASFSDYRGRKFALKVVPPDHEFCVRSYWDGGTKSSYRLVSLRDFRSMGLPETAHKPVNFGGSDAVFTLPEDVALVEHDYFCGKDMGITVHIRADNATKMLPKTEAITEHETTVLLATASLKNTYGGQTDIRFKKSNRKTGITKEQWLEAQASLRNKGMLRKNNSITPDGRNAISAHPNRLSFF